MEFERNKSWEVAGLAPNVTLEFKAEVVRHNKAERLTATQTGAKFDLFPKRIQQWEKL